MPAGAYFSARGIGEQDKRGKIFAGDYWGASWGKKLSKCQGFSVKIALLGVKMGKIMLR